VRVALYSAIYGGYERPKPLPADLDVPAILYTDDPELDAPGWELRVVTNHLDGVTWADPRATTAMMRHKYWKCHPAEAVSDVDVSIWMDSSMSIAIDRYVEHCLDALGDDDWTAIKHPWRSCIYDEASFSSVIGRYDAKSLADQAAFYRSIGHPTGWGLFATGANVRRHRAPVVELAGNWWYECITRTHQDQISLPVLFRLAEETGLRWNVNMPWWQWWNLHHHGT
jgi:hypothetical protein